MSGGGSSSIAIGGSIARGWVLAGTIGGSAITNTLDGGPFEDATVTADGETTSASAKVAATVSHLGVLVDWYPDPSTGWHVGASAGLGSVAIINQADDSTMTGPSGGASAFGGYDWSIGPDWSLGVALVASGNGSAKMLDSDEDDTGYRLKSYSIGITGSVLYF
ncbi:MAG: hypothetical protein JW940_34690 [Polyangiaceae bacterium]|nr:hypothetical protein [Polyangiaceae bacterium]